MHSAKRQIHCGRNVRTLPGPRFWHVIAVLAGLLCGWLPQPAAQADGKAGKDAAEVQPVAYSFDVTLPITDAVEKSVTKRVEQAIAKLPKNGPRPVFVFELRPPSGTAGEGSSFGDALDLARFLSGDRLSQAK